jgi:hypothetical protein
MLKFLSTIIVILVVIALIPLTLLGVVPGLSSLIGAAPVDLGIHTTPEESALARGKVGTQIVSLPENTPASEDFKLEGKKPAEFTFDSQELTAHTNNRPWKNFPLKNVQIKIHPDGTIESSAILIISKAMPYALGLGYSETQIRDAMSKYSIPSFEVPIYIKGLGSVANDQVTVNAQSVKIGAVPIPNGMVTQANQEAESVLNDLIAKHNDAFHAESVTFSEGKMFFKGDLPLKESVITR